jgi:hypothetical protein
MTTSQNPLAGYTQIPKASETIAERLRSFQEFQVVDIDNPIQQEKIPETENKKVNKTKKTAKADIIQINQESVVKPKEPDIQPQKNVVFITPYTDVSVDAFQVYIDGEIFSIVTPSEDRVKVKPKRGIKLNAIYNEIEYNLYASGIYIPIDKLNSIMSIFFIVDENKEEE